MKNPIKGEKKWCSICKGLDTTHKIIFGEYFSILFSDLCEVHDKHYINHDVSRKEADKELAQGIKEKGYNITSVITYLAVRAKGKKRWNKFS